MSKLSNVRTAVDSVEPPARRASDSKQTKISATRSKRLSLVPSTKAPDYWQTESRSEALKRAIARTG